MVQGHAGRGMRALVGAGLVAALVAAGCGKAKDDSPAVDEPGSAEEDTSSTSPSGAFDLTVRRDTDDDLAPCELFDFAAVTAGDPLLDGLVLTDPSASSGRWSCTFEAPGIQRGGINYIPNEVLVPPSGNLSEVVASRELDHDGFEGIANVELIDPDDGQTRVTAQLLVDNSAGGNAGTFAVLGVSFDYTAGDVEPEAALDLVDAVVGEAVAVGRT